VSGHVVALSGGVGGAKLAHGLYLALGADHLTVIANTGDDFRHLGLYVSPDIDSIVYALAELSDPVRGWGRRDESWNFMEALEGLGGETWFALGDRDLAMHVERSRRLALGETLSSVTMNVCRALGIHAHVLPMSDDPVRTRLLTGDGWLDFQDYFVRHRCAPSVREIAFAGAEIARAQPQALAALSRPDLRAIVICPSNPFVSIDPILAVPGIREALQRATAPVIAVSPIIDGRALKGPAAKMMSELGLEVSSRAVAQRYVGLADVFIHDETESRPDPIPGMTLATAPTVMHDDALRLTLARCVLETARRCITRQSKAGRMPITR
jgi:LPPG:FO 2-phospho-L-lactate transferase